MFELFYMLDSTDLFATLSAYPIIDVVMVAAMRKILGDYGRGLWRPIPNSQIVQYLKELGFPAREITPDLVVFEKNQTMMRQDRNYCYLEYLKKAEERPTHSKQNSNSKINYVNCRFE